MSNRLYQVYYNKIFCPFVLALSHLLAIQKKQYSITRGFAEIIWLNTVLFFWQPTFFTIKNFFLDVAGYGILRQLVNGDCSMVRFYRRLRTRYYTAFLILRLLLPVFLTILTLLILASGAIFYSIIHPEKTLEVISPSDYHMYASDFTW